MGFMKNDFETTFKKASLAHRQGRLAEAENAYLAILKEKPDSGTVLNALGTVYLDQSHPDRARTVFEKAAHLDPPDIAACYNLGRLKQMEQDHSGAIEIYRGIVKKTARIWFGVEQSRSSLPGDRAAG